MSINKEMFFNKNAVCQVLWKTLQHHNTGALFHLYDDLIDAS